MLGLMESWSLVDICEAQTEQVLWALERVREPQETTPGVLEVRGALGGCAGYLLSLGVRAESLGCGLCGLSHSLGWRRKRVRIPRLHQACCVASTLLLGWAAARFPRSTLPWPSLVCLTSAHLGALGLAQSSPCSVSPPPLPSLAVFSQLHT